MSTKFRNLYSFSAHINDSELSDFLWEKMKDLVPQDKIRLDGETNYCTDEGTSSEFLKSFYLWNKKDWESLKDTDKVDESRDKLPCITLEIKVVVDPYSKAEVEIDLSSVNLPDPINLRFLESNGHLIPSDKKSLPELIEFFLNSAVEFVLRSGYLKDKE